MARYAIDSRLRGNDGSEMGLLQSCLGTQQGLLIFTLNATKGLSGVGEILRCAQNDSSKKVDRNNN